MQNIDWKRKLTSRKLWLSVANFVSMLMVAFGSTENEATQVAAIIMAGAGVVGYIIAEGLADAATVDVDFETVIESAEDIKQPE